MQLTQNFSECPPPSVVTPGNFNVRAFYTETDAGHIFGTFTSREKAENCLLVLAARSDVIKATVEVA